MPDELTPARENAIMETTRTVLGERGYAGLSLETVAGRSDTTRSQLATHYDGPESLVADFVAYERDRFEERLMVAPDDPRKRLRSLLELLVGLRDYEADDLVPAYLELYGAAAHSERLRTALIDLDAFLFDAVAATIEEGIEAGQFRRVDPEAAATQIYAAHECALRRRALGQDVSPLLDSLDRFVLSEIRR